jgi:hypothetical protein
MILPVVEAPYPGRAESSMHKTFNGDPFPQEGCHDKQKLSLFSILADHHRWFAAP